MLGVIIGIVAPHKSWLSPKWFKTIFITADIFCLVMQSAGGGWAATADTNSSADAGGHLMLAGIILQLIVMIVYVLYGLFWAKSSRGELEAAGRDIHKLLFGMTLASIMVIIRGVYRTAELSQGWNGSIATNQPTFLLDAIPISIATLALK
ncbi:hypothetical protein P7C70_g4913, partial [Phenoliferia sp. Uapishka_3]